MWPWLKCGSRWGARKLAQLRSLVGRPQLQSFRFSYRKAGMVMPDEPIPWNADTVLVDVVLKFPPGVVWPKEEFYLRAPGSSPTTAISLERLEPDGCFCAGFQLRPLHGPTSLTVHWRMLSLGQRSLPYLSAAEFLQNLRVEAPTVFARLGDQHVACQAVVEGQCAGLLACGLLKSPTPLLPLVDLNLALQLTEVRTGRTRNVPIRLTRSQLLDRQAVLSAGWPLGPGETGSWKVHWLAANRVLASNEVCTVSRGVFRRSLGLADSSCQVGETAEEAAFPQNVPKLDGNRQAGPSFRVVSREPGLAGLCSLDLCAHLSDGGRIPAYRRNEVVVIDVPSSLFPTPLTSLDIHRIDGFELFGDGEFLGFVSKQPRSAVSFTSEGGFRGVADFPWTPFAEAELDQRLNKLLGVPSA